MKVTEVCRLLVFYAFLFFMMGCQSDQRDAISDEAVDEIVVRLSDQPESFSPFMAKSAIARQVYKYMYNTLGDYDYQTSELKPVLIEALPAVTSTDSGGSRYTMRIKEDAVWEDGTPVTGHDVAWSFKIIFHPGVVIPAVRGSFEDVQDVQVDEEDPKSFTIVTNTKKFLEKDIILNCDLYPKAVYDAAGILDAYSIAQLKQGEVLLSDESLKQVGEDFSSITYIKEKAGGSGPYELENYTEGQFVVLKKKEDYWGLNYPDVDQLNQYPERIIFRIIPDETTALTLLKNKEVDFMDFSRSAIAQYNDLIQDSTFSQDFDFEQTTIPRFIYVLMNHEDEKLSDVHVRKALRHLTNTDRVIELLAGGYAQPQNGPIHRSKPHYNADITLEKYNPDLAKKILDDGGWIDSDGDGIRDKVINGRRVPLTLSWHISGSATSTSLSALVLEAAKEVGMNIEIIEKPFGATRTENLYTGDYDITVMQKTQSQLLDDLYLAYHSTSIGGGGDNLMRYSDEKVDELVQVIRTTDSDSERLEAYAEVQEILYEDVDAIYLYSPELKFVVNDDINPALSPLTPGYFLNSKEE